MIYDRKKGCTKYPYAVNIGITERCNLKCPFCYMKHGQVEELDIHTLKKYLDELEQMGTKMVQFGGGEPLLHPNLLELIAYAKSKDMYVRVASSGFDLTEQMADELEKVGLDVLHISLNGSTKLIHEKTRNGYDQAIRALQIMKDRNVNVCFNWVANHSNIDDLPNMVELAHKYNVQSISILANKRSNQGYEYEPLTKEDLNQLKEMCLANKDFLIPESCFYILRLIMEPNKVFAFDKGCRAGRYNMAINVKGEFMPCPHLFDYASKYDTIQEYWENDTKLDRLRQAYMEKVREACKDCVYMKHCNPCYEITDNLTEDQNMKSECIIYSEGEV